MISEVNLAVKKPPMIHCPLNWLPASNHKLYILHTRAEKLSSVRLTYESNIVQTKGTLDVGNDWGLLTGGVGILEISCRVSVAMHYKFDKKLSYFLLYLVKKYVYLIIYTK